MLFRKKKEFWSGTRSITTDTGEQIPFEPVDTSFLYILFRLSGKHPINKCLISEDGVYNILAKITPNGFIIKNAPSKNCNKPQSSMSITFDAQSVAKYHNVNDSRQIKLPVYYLSTDNKYLLTVDDNVAWTRPELFVRGIYDLITKQQI